VKELGLKNERSARTFCHDRRRTRRYACERTVAQGVQLTHALSAQVEHHLLRVALSSATRIQVRSFHPSWEECACVPDRAAAERVAYQAAGPLRYWWRRGPKL